MKLKNILLALAFTAGTSFSGSSYADTYNIDTKGAHAFVQFKIQHLGYSWLYGRFDKFSGTFEYDEKNPAAASIEMTVDTASVNSNHTMRDKHLRNDDFLNVEKFPTATFKSTGFKESENGNGAMTGDLTLNGVTQSINLDVELIGAGKDPWGGFRRGYEAKGEIKLSDFKIKKSLGPKSESLFLTISVEGIKQK